MKPSVLYHFLTLGTVLPFFLALGQKILTPEIDKYIETVLSESGSNGTGLSVGVVRLDSESKAWTVETKGYGPARLSDNEPVTAETLFPIASNSKLFTAIATGLLISDKNVAPRISWTSKMASIIPSWGLLEPFASEKSSILDLLGHRTGLPSHDLIYRKGDTVASVIERLRYLKPSAEFREEFQYANNMYNVLSYLPEILSTKVPLARYVKKNIFEPLGLNSTTYSFDIANATGKLSLGISNGLISGTKVQRQLPFWFTEGGEDGNVMSGAAGIISNANDMARWLQTLILQGREPITNKSIIPEQIIKQTTSGLSITSNGLGPGERILSPEIYGAGSQVNSYRGHTVVWHNGHVPGSSSQVARFPFDNIGVVVLTNDDDFGTLTSEIIKYRIMDSALGLEPYPWKDLIYGLSSDTGPSIPGGLARTRISTRPPTFSQSSVKRQTNATGSSIPGSFPALEGTYFDPGYGNWTFCLIDPSYNSTSAECRDLVANISSVLPGQIDSNTPTLLTKINAVTFGGYIMLQHTDADIWRIQGFSSFPTMNDPKQDAWVKTAFEVTGTARFEVVNGTIGFGLSGGIWGVFDTEPQGDTLREQSEVYFEKL